MQNIKNCIERHQRQSNIVFTDNFKNENCFYSFSLLLNRNRRPNSKAHRAEENDTIYFTDEFFFFFIIFFFLVRLSHSLWADVTTQF